MATTGTGVSAVGYSTVINCLISSSTGRAGFKPKGRVCVSASLSTGRSIASTGKQLMTTTGSKDGRSVNETEADTTVQRYDMESEVELLTPNLQEYVEQSKDLMRSDGGPPRWFSPLDCGSRLNNSPLLLYLPGIDGVGLGLILHHPRLGEIFDVWCLHIPATDRTPLTELMKLVERTVMSENYHSPERPIYLVGESFGGCLALAVAARNPEIDFILVLANPATCFSKSQLQPLIPLLQIMPGQLHVGLPYMLTLLTGTASKMAMATMEKGLPLQQAITVLSQGLVALSSFLPGLAGAFTVEMLLWKLKMLESACAYSNSRLHAVKAQTLILSSGRDQFLPSLEEGERLRHMLPKCDIRTFNESDHFLFLEHGHDLVTIIKATSFYRRTRYFDYVLDYLPPSPSEFRKVAESHRWVEMVYSPVMLSTLENGKIVRNLAGIPTKGPVLFVGYHMMLGLELAPIVSRILSERNILVRGIAHPFMFTRSREGKMPAVSTYDGHRIMGAVPVSAANFYKLFSKKCHVLLYPGGMREALHRKGEEYRLFWPEQSEFVRMAARFGAKIIPFGSVGEDDVGQLILDYDDQVKIPILKALNDEITEEVVRLRNDFEGEVANQQVHLPVMLPKLPGRFYYLFGKPIETEGRKQELRSREKAHELYLEVKLEVEKCLAYLKEKRENDPYRSILSRSVYQVTHGFESEIPSFDL